MTAAHDATYENPNRAHSSLMCAPYETGYELHPIQRQVAIATPSRWRDSIVVDVATEGWVELRDLTTDASTRVWNFTDLGATVTRGEPVTLNAHYGVLAVGRTYFSVRID